MVEIALGYARCFGLEHGYRIDKRTLLWGKLRLLMPEQFEQWRQVVAIVHNHLMLGRPLVELELRPWESRYRAATPQQVGRGFHKLLKKLGFPARSPPPSGKARGRMKGVKVRKAERMVVVKKKMIIHQHVPV